MPDYDYTATDSAGARVQGVVAAANSALAAGKVRALGYTPERVRVAGSDQQEGNAARPPEAQSRRDPDAESWLRAAYSGVPLKELAAFYRQFATLIDAGLPLYQSLAAMERQTHNPRMQQIVRDLQRQVESGGPISGAMERYPSVFTELQRQMIRAAEQGGMLQAMLLRIADYLENEMKLRRLINGLTLYSKLVVVSAFFILGVGLFADGMPAISKVILGGMGKGNYSVLDYLKETLFPFLLILGAIYGGSAIARLTLLNNSETRLAYERVKLAIPGLGSVIKGFALARFGQAFGAMYAAGMPLSSSLRAAGQASGTHLLERAAAQAATEAERGGRVSDAFRASGIFPNIIIDMLSTGEQTGNVDGMMMKASEYLEGDAKERAQKYAHIFSVVVYLIVAILVAMSIIRFYTGYADRAVGGGG